MNWQPERNESIRNRGKANLAIRNSQRKTWQINSLQETTTSQLQMAMPRSIVPNDSIAHAKINQNEALVLEMDQLISKWAITRQEMAWVVEENRGLKMQCKSLLIRQSEQNAHHIELEEQLKEQRLTIRSLNEKLAEYQHVNSHYLRAPVVTILGLVNLMRMMESDQLGEVVRKLEETAKELNCITLEVQKIVSEF